jgi:hypothetical protein
MPDGTAAHAGSDRRVLGLLHRAPLLYTAVDTGRGLHVTPTAFAWNGRALWVVAPRESVKARAVRHRPRVGLLLRLRDRSLVASGPAELVDPLHGQGVFSAARLFELPFAGLGYTARNTGHIAGLLRDLGPDPRLALDRVVIRIALDRYALLDGDGPAATWGGWPGGSLSGPVPAAVPGPDGSALPEPLSRLVTGGGGCCLAWPTPDGPVALPARWAGGGRLAEVGAGLMSLVGASRSGPAALTVDAGGYRLSSKYGVMLRGNGTAGVAGPTALVALPADRITYWRGAESGTLRVSPAPAEAG